MADAADPFEDPEIKAAMAKAGIVHRPGMAAEMMQELAPLLAAEGVDLENPDEDTDLETINAALARATEQHNLELFTPVGQYRDQVLTVLQEFTEAVSRKRGERDAEAVLDSIEPEPSEARPAASHVIGATLGLLDTWYTDSKLAGSLGQVAIPKWRGPARSTARNLVAAARKGQAYASLDTLIMRHGGRFVMDSAVLAAAATILAYAQTRKIDIAQAAKVLYEHTGPVAPAAPASAGGAAFGSQAAHSNRRQALLADFRSWAADGDDPSPELESQVSLLETLMGLASQEHLDPGDPDDTSYLIDLILEAGNPDAAGTALQALDQYVHFQLATSNETADWEATHGDVEIALDELNPAPRVLSAAIEETAALSESAQLDALGTTRLVAAVPEVLAWLGTSQQITGAGGLRRSDIEQVAAMIGVSAVGVAKRPHQLPELSLQATRGETPAEPETIYAQSTNDVPMLAAWWRALQFAEVTELTATRVRPGPHAGDFTDGEPSVLKSAEFVVVVFVAEMLVREAEGPGFYFGEHVVTLALSRLLEALAPGDFQADDDESELAHLLEVRVSMLMTKFELVGLMSRNGDGDLLVPVALRGAVAKGVLTAVEIMAGTEEDE